MNRAAAAILTSALIASLAGTAAAQPTITLLPPFNSIQIIGLEVSDDGQTACGFVAGNQSFIWRANGVPQITVVNGGGGNDASGPLSSVAGMDSTGSRFLFSYRDAVLAPDDIYTGGLTTPAIYENDQFNVIAPVVQADGCDQSLVSARALSGDGQTVIGAAWNRCRVAPFAWTAANGWTAWATQDSFPPFGQTGYESHQVTAVSSNGAVGSGWFQSGVGYGGRTALVWTNYGATVSRLDLEPHSVLWGQADAVSANGVYVAGSMIPTDLIPEGENPQHGNKFLYRWTASGGVQVLPGKVNTAPGSNRHPVVSGISNDGNIIVGQDSFGIDREAFIWTPTTGGMKLTDYLATKGLDLPNTQFINLTSAAGMSSNGRFITGQYMDFGGTVGPFVLDLGEQQCGAADLGSAGGIAGPDNALDNNDFIAFINLFFASNPQADMGISGGGPGQDGAFDNNDFIAFINHFFAGC